jgi:hypothetical protein
MRSNNTAVPAFSAARAKRRLAVRSSRRVLPSTSTITAPAAPLRAISAVAFSAESRSGACTLKQHAGSIPNSAKPGGYSRPPNRRKGRTKKQGPRSPASIAPSMAPKPNRLASSHFSRPRISWQALPGSSLNISASDPWPACVFPSAASAWPHPASGSDSRIESLDFLFILCSYRF